MLSLQPTLLEPLETGLTHTHILLLNLLQSDVIICFYMAVLDSDEEISEKSTDEDQQCSTLEELTDIHFKFEVKEVCWFLCSELSSSREDRLC